jgi:hypothetical protein
VNYADERPIKPAPYKLIEPPQSTYNYDELQIEEDYQETEEAEQDSEHRNIIVRAYKQILDNQIELQSAKALAKEEETARQEHKQ